MSSTTPLTLSALQETLAEVERREGLIVARRFVAALDYDQLVALARRGAAGDVENRADLLDPRYLTLWGMRGEHVRDLQEALVSLGYACPVTGEYDDETYCAYWAWLGREGRVAPAARTVARAV